MHIVVVERSYPGSIPPQSAVAEVLRGPVS